METPKSVATLEAARDEILWWEICSILHDVGKLSSEFHEYRQTWFRLPNGWAERDPHDHNWLDRDKLLGDLLQDIFRRSFVPAPKDGDAKRICSVLEAAHEHTNGKTPNRLVQLLRVGDAMDSRYDRNNPLISNEQTDWSGRVRETYRSNVYGYETGRAVEGHVLDRERAALYAKLGEVLPQALHEGLTWERVCEIKGEIERRFEAGMSDTTRPGNDTSLWEHTYAVATLAKALHAQDATSPIPGLGERRAEPFALYGVGVDTWRWCSQGQRVGDILGRKAQVDEAFEGIRKLIEFDCPLGNRIYADDSFHVYAIGRVQDLRAVVSWLDGQVEAVFRESSNNDLKGTTWLLEETLATTAVVQVIEELRRKVTMPSAWVTEPKVTEHGENKDLCPICQRRPQLAMGVCLPCRNRREPVEQIDGNRTEETRMLSEIAGRSGRVALVVARFGLRDWLNGQMTRSCPVTEPDGISRMGDALEQTVELRGEAEEFREWLAAPGRDLRSYDGMLAELTLLRKKGERKEEDLGASVFARSPVWGGRGIVLNRKPADAEEAWKEDLKAFLLEGAWNGSEEAALLSAVCTKTPTPSTTLDAWMTTKEFFQRAAQWARDLIPQGSRRSVAITPVPAWLDRQKTVEVVGHGGDFLYSGGRLWILKDARLPETVELQDDNSNARTAVTTSDFDEQGKPFLPWSTLTASPDVLMMLVPAEYAATLTKRIAREYDKEFAKVEGRLPIAVGNIYFPQHQPMFAVLDAAWRMTDNFRRLQENVLVLRPYKRGRRLLLGNCARDSFHNHVICEGKPEVGSAFLTRAGWVGHRDDLPEDTATLERPNIYDGVVLGGAAARLNLNLSANLEAEEVIPLKEIRQKLFGREHEQPVGMMLLEEFERCLEVWSKLGSAGIGDRPLRNLWFALESRRSPWATAGGGEELQKLGDTLGAHYLGNDWGVFREDFLDGHLERSLRLHWAILKDRLDKERLD